MVCEKKQNFFHQRDMYGILFFAWDFWDRGNCTMEFSGRFVGQNTAWPLGFGLVEMIGTSSFFFYCTIASPAPAR